MVTPYTNAFLPRRQSNVQNITLQTQCPQDGSDHISIAYDSNALQDMINALGRGRSRLPAVVRRRRADNRQRLTTRHARWSRSPYVTLCNDILTDRESVFIFRVTQPTPGATGSA